MAAMEKRRVFCDAASGLPVLGMQIRLGLTQRQLMKKMEFFSKF